MTRTFSDLAGVLGRPASALQSIEVSYRQFEVPKPQGGARLICAPAPSLLQLQRDLLHVLLHVESEPDLAVMDWPGRSTVSHAKLHCNSSVVVKADIRNFFGATHTHRIRAFFKRQGWDDETVAWLVRVCTLNGSLPQGAATSSALASLVNARMDRDLQEVAKANQARYSRYADDMAFSGTIEAPTTLIRVVQKTLRRFGYELARGKTSVERRGRPQTLVGLNVDTERPRVPRKLLRRVAAAERERMAGRAGYVNGVPYTDQVRAGYLGYFKMVGSS